MIGVKINEFEQTLDEFQSGWDGRNEKEIAFWLNTTFRTFMQTMSEVINKKSLNIILEMTGYKIGEYFHQYCIREMEDKDQLIELFMKKYVEIGWGELEIEDRLKECGEIIITYKRDWEAINEYEKSIESFYPGVFAGFYSEFFSTNMWYKIVDQPSEGNKVVKLKIYPIEITPKDRIKELHEKQELEDIIRLEAIVEDRTRELEKLIIDLSSPIIPVLEHIVVVPMIGRFDEKRSKELLEKTLKGATTYQASIVIFDVTAMNKMDYKMVSLLKNIAQTITIIGATPIIVGVSPELSMQLVSSGIELHRYKCFATLKHAIHFAIALEGMQLIKK